jgi:hypothetical protein
MTSECDVLCSKLAITDTPSLQCFYLFTHLVLGFMYLLRSLLKTAFQVPQSIFTPYSTVFGDAASLSPGYCQSISPAAILPSNYWHVSTGKKSYRDGNYVASSVGNHELPDNWLHNQVCNTRYALDGGHILMHWAWKQRHSITILKNAHDFIVLGQFSPVHSYLHNPS